MTAPVIGLTTYREDAAWGVWRQRADVLPTAYAAAVEATGGVPVLLPPVGQAGAADAVVARLDGLVISGGADVDPGRYDASPHPRTAGWRPDRDAWESALLDAADAAGLPVLGVCRGMQLMAVHAGGRARPAHARTSSTTSGTARARTSTARSRCRPRPARGSPPWSGTGSR